MFNSASVIKNVVEKLKDFNPCLKNGLVNLSKSLMQSS